MFESKKKIEMWVSCGDDFFYGLEGEKKDFEMAVDFYEKAAKKKHPRAAFMLGLCYDLGGKGIKKNIKTAEAWYKLAVEYGSDEAQKRLESGKVVVPPPPEDDDDDEYDEEANDGGTDEIPAADMNLAEDYEQRGELAKAFEHYKKAAEAGSGEACYLYSKKFSIVGIAADIDEQIKWLEKAVALGYDAAEAELKTTKKSAGLVKFAQDSWAKEAAEKVKEKKIRENEEAWKKACSYINNKDPKSAVPYLTKIAESLDDNYLKGYAEVQLAMVYTHGADNVPYNEEKAAYWAKRGEESAVKLNDEKLIQAANDVFIALDELRCIEYRKQLNHG